MGVFRLAKVIASLPGTLIRDTFYAVRTGAGYDLYLSDATGTVAHPLNSGGAAEETFETVSKNLSAEDAVLNYTSDVLTSIVYANGITKTFSYTADGLSTVVLSGSVPGGISLTKTLSYTSGTLTGVSYS
jgi:hypothetical protein